MGGFLDKIGLYNFFGIIGPGIISASYYTFSYCLLTGNSRFLYDDNINAITIGVICIFSYLYGIILHETGKIVFDIGKRFNAEKKKKQLCEEQRESSLLDIDTEYNEYIKKIRKFVYETDFNFALCKLKYSDCNTRKIDAYHSIYGQSRGLMISFVIHFALLFAFGYNRADIILTANIHYISYLAVFDCVMFVLFLIRSYRYFLSWIRNVYYQYYFLYHKRTIKKTRTLCQLSSSTLDFQTQFSIHTSQRKHSLTERRNIR